MSFVFSKNKEKRSRSSTGVTSNSFVRNVTSRVSGLLPAGITKWFSSPSSSRTNGAAAVADGTDSSTEDEAPESIAPPAKRLRFSSPVNYSQLTTSETTLTSNVITESGSVLYQTIQSPPGRTTYRQETNFNSTPIRAQSEGMNINTTDRSETDNLHQRNTVSVIEKSKSQKRKSLFNNEDQQEQALMACAKTAANIMKDPKQPHFKPNLLCSPFYSGRTMYGGASSSIYMNEPNTKHRKMTCVNESKDTDSVNLSNSSRRVMDLLENYSSPLIDARRLPRYELSELTDVNRSLPDPNTSKRNAYKTQELYIPSTASVIRMKARSRLMDSTKAARQIIASHSSTLSFHGYDPIDRDQWSEPKPGKSQSKLKTRLTRTSRGDTFGMPETLDLPTAVLQIDSKDLPNFSLGGSVSKTSFNPPSEPFKFSIPLPVNLDRNRTSSPCPAYEFGIPEKATANKSPPKFSFGNQNRDAITNPLTDNQELSKSQGKEKSVITFAKAATKSYDQVTKQTAPKANETTAKCSICKLANSHTNSDKCVNCEKIVANPKPTANQFPVANKTSTKWKCRECYVENDNSTDNCVCCGSQNSKKQNAPTADVPDKVGVVLPAAKAGADERISCDGRNKWKCSACWVENDDSTENCVCCGSRNSKKAIAPPADVPDKADLMKSAAKAGTDERIRCDDRNKWKCCDCWVENDDNTDNCVACGSRNSKKPTALPTVPDKVDLGTSAATKDWRCDDCMITNKPSIDKCAACGGAKPGTKASAKSLPSFSTSNFFNKPDSKLAEIVEAQKSYWECSICLASNNNDKLTCMCCETAKDAKDKSPKSPPKFSNFKFDVKSNLGFKFGIDPKVQEKNLTKKLDEKLPKKMEESETNNNIIAGTPNFTFSIPAKNMELKFDGSKTNEDPKPSFSFGIPTQNSTSVTSNFTFKPLNDTKLPDIVKPVEETEKPQEVPSISLKAPEIAKPVTGLFAAPASTANPLNAMNAFLNNSSEIKAVSPNKNEAKPQFTFSAVKPASGGLFAPPASVAASSLTTQDTPSQPPMLGMFAKTDANAPSSAVSFFSKSDNPTPAPSPFQNAAPAAPANAAAPTAAAAPAAAPAVVPSMFSFGSNQSTNASSASSEPKKFNFTFGSSTSTPIFGATQQSNSSGFGLTTNPLSNGPATIAMAGNGISSNPLGSGMSTTSLGGASSVNGIIGSGGAPMFNAPAKENTNMTWPNTSEQTNQVNPFMSTPSKPQFTFGATPSPTPFGTPANNIAQAPIVFGAPSQPAQNMFGMNQNNTSQPSMFSNPTQTQQPSSLFGNPMFGVPNASPFGTSTPSMSTFEAPAMAPASTPAFNFGAPQSSPAVFGFGQQPGDAMQTMQSMQGVQGMQAAEGIAGGFSFNATPAPGQMQFNIGSAPSGASGRRVRKAVRRIPQR